MNCAACPVTRKELVGDLPHAGKTSYLRGQFDADDPELVERGGGVLQGCAVCLSNAGVEEPLVGLIVGGKERGCNGQLGVQRVVLQTWC